MCIVCMEYHKGKLTAEDAKRNVREIIDSALGDALENKESVMTEEELDHLMSISDNLDNGTDLD